MNETIETRVTREGHIALPEALRERRGWDAGVVLVIEERAEGVLLRAPAKTQAKATYTRYEDVRGSLGPVKRALTIEEMNEGLREAVRRRWKRTSLASD